MKKINKKKYLISFSLILTILVSMLALLFINAATPPASGNYKIYYYRTDATYSGWGVHLWNDDGWGPTGWGGPALFSEAGTTTGSPAIPYTIGTETIGGLDFVFIEFPEPTVGSGLKFIIHKGDTKDPDGDRIWPSPELYQSVMCKSGELALYTENSSGEVIPINYITSAEISGTNKISLKMAAGVKIATDTFVLKENDATVDVTNGFVDNSKSGVLTLVTGNFDFSKTYSLIFNSQNPTYLYAGAGFIDGASSGLTPNVTEQLGCSYSGGTATFKVWAPFANEAKVNFYSTWDADNSADKTASHSLTKGAGGVWSATVSSVTEGQLYQYELVYGTSIKRVLDPYAKSMAAFSNSNAKDYVGKAAVVNPSSHNPTGWIDGTYYNLSQREDAIIYEVHVRDFTIGLTSAQLNGKTPGTYEAFVEKIQYLKDLGVTHVQLLPVMNYYYGNETANTTVESDYSYKNNNFNWGYDPHNYFSPEGMYSSSPTSPTARILELKTLIKAIHDNGMAVTLDVVYNHTANKGVFQDLTPGYWYRVKDGIETNKSGCGNDVETAHKMVRKLIVDSIKYWVDEYNVDGFRFDLMGIMDQKTIQEAYAAASALNPKTLFIGEGWQPMYEGPSLDFDGVSQLKGADQMWMTETNIVSVFSDSYRDYLKMGGFNEGLKGFLTDSKVSRANLLLNIMGQPTNFTADDPGDCVQYISAHDGFTWHDTVAYSVKLDPDATEDKAEIFKRLKNGQVVLLTSQGVSFIHAGCEMGRTKQYVGDPSLEGWDANNYDVRFESVSGKYYVRNSYDSSDALNKIDWNKLSTDTDRTALMEYTKGLIKLKKSTDAFRLGTKTSVDTNVTIIE